jgi:trehalose synthase
MTVAARVEEYRDVAPRGALELLARLAERLQGRRFVHVNASRYGAGSSEILARLVPMLQDLGIDAAWEVIGGDPAFYAATRTLDAALGGQPVALTEAMLVAYTEAAATNAAALPLEGDLVMVHDVGPLALARHRRGRGRWVWRCHTDVSRAWRRAWHLVRRELESYDAVIFSLPKFAQRVRMPMLVVHPSIDPLSDKNRDLSRAEVQQVLDRFGIARDRPLLVQVAPFTRATEPMAALTAFRLVRKYVPCRLVLAGWGASDNPEGTAVLQELREAAGRDPEIHVLVVPPDAAREVNAIQRAAALVLHLPRHDDFSLAVTEAMWKGKPVVGSLTGGIPTQVLFEVTGYTAGSVEGAAFRARQLLQNPDLAARLGGAAREYVRRNFLLPRHLGDYLALLAHMTA